MRGDTTCPLLTPNIVPPGKYRECGKTHTGHSHVRCPALGHQAHSHCWAAVTTFASRTSHLPTLTSVPIKIPSPSPAPASPPSTFCLHGPFCPVAHVRGLPRTRPPGLALSPGEWHPPVRPEFKKVHFPWAPRASGEVTTPDKSSLSVCLSPRCPAQPQPHPRGSLTSPQLSRARKEFREKNSEHSLASYNL